jgi:hypothetical protein
MATTTYYALVIGDESTVEDPDGIVRVINDGDELHAEFYDYDEGEWWEQNRWLDRIYDPMEYDGKLTEITRAAAKAIFKRDGIQAKLDRPAAGVWTD